MDTFQALPQHLLDDESIGPKPVRQLIQRGRDLLSQGSNVEGISLLMHAYTQLAAETSPIFNLLESIVNSYAKYEKTHKALIDASRDYARAEAEWQAQLRALTVQNERNAATLSSTAPLLHQSDEQCCSAARDNASDVMPSTLSTTQRDYLPALYITCFGRFVVRRGGKALELCGSRNGQAILRFLVAQQGYRATADTLMEMLWPGEELENARRKLHVAVSHLRHSLNCGFGCDPGGGYIFCKNQLYQINPAVTLLTDVDEFLALYRSGGQGSRAEMIARYEQACRLYHDPFLAEDLYADWSIRLREQLMQAYIAMCGVLCNHFLETGRYENALHWARTMLEANRCDEEAYRNLMRAYAALGRRNDALRQYHCCGKVLLEELNVSPMPETVQVYHDILAGYTLPAQEGK
jgi:DNA-binding SARP family transcriptional activator